MESGVKYRNMWGQVGLTIITIGIYCIYWFYQTVKEMKGLAGDPTVSPGLWTVLMFVPLANFYAMYKYAELFQKISSESLNRWIIFLLWLVFSPAVWFVVQTELNNRATYNKPKSRRHP